MAHYEYQTLGVRQMRLLQLASGAHDDPLSGTLATFLLPSDEDEDEDTPVQAPSTESAYNAPPRYRALSYYWGSGEATSRIYLAHSKNETKKTVLKIKPNLERALKKLRREIKEGEFMDVWTDAICINQANLPERNAQIKEMAMIYSKAEAVHIWLGDKSEDSDLAMEFAKEIKDPKSFEQALKLEEARAGEWLAFGRLMHREWFSRRWVVQEISLAKKAVVHCGDQDISWDDLEEAISIFSVMESDIRKRVRSSRKHGNPIDFLGEVKGLGATHLVEIASNMTQRTHQLDRQATEHRMSLEGLMSTLTMFETTNPYDIVYALLWLAHDAQPGGALSNDYIVKTPVGSPSSMSRLNSPVESNRAGRGFLDAHGATQDRTLQRSLSDVLRREEASKKTPADLLEVNYNKTLFECYKNFLSHVFKHSKSLDIICRAWALEPPQKAPDGARDGWTQEEPLPSWIQILTENKTFDSNSRNPLYERVKADPLVGKPGTGPRRYNACGKQKHEGKYASFREDDRTLRVRGFALGNIIKREDPANEGVVPASWLRAVGWTCPPRTHREHTSIRLGQKRGRPDWLWRFLVAERGHDGYQPPPMRYRSACTWLLDNRIPKKGFTARRAAIGECPELVGEYIDRVSSVVWGRRLVHIDYETSSSKCLGLAPEEADTGDLICIIYGCSVPVVLRKTEPLDELPVVDDVPSIAIQEPQPEEPLGPPLKRPRVEVPGLTQDAPPRNRRAPSNNVDFSGETYEFIGECYVYSMMAGEGFKRGDEHGIKARMYTLV